MSTAVTEALTSFVVYCTLFARIQMCIAINIDQTGWIRLSNSDEKRVWQPPGEFLHARKTLKISAMIAAANMLDVYHALQLNADT